MKQHKLVSAVLAPLAGRLGIPCAPRFLLLLLLGPALPPAAQAQFEYTTNLGAITLTLYTGTDDDVAVPGETNGLPVTTIGNSAFYGCTTLARVTVPASVTSIGDDAFRFCSRLTNITLGTRVTNLGNGAFYGCTSLPRVTIPPSVARIGSAAFRNCARLLRITLPAGVASIGDGAFYGCAGLVAFEVDSANAIYSSAGGILFDKTRTTLIQCPGAKVGSCSIPDGVASIGKHAFSGCARLTHILIPQGVTRIGEWAFSESTSLTSATIPPGVDDIAEGLFYSCTGLTNVTLPATVTRIGLLAFRGCASLPHIALPDRVTRVGNYAFSSCTSLTRITLPDGIADIEDGTFYSCSSLASVTMGKSVMRIGEWAFYGCDSLTGVCFQRHAPQVDASAFSGADHATVYRLPGTTGWGAILGGRPTALWRLPHPVILAFPPAFGMMSNGFGFTISWATSATVVVETSANPAAPTWSAVGTNTLSMGGDPLVDGWSLFSDPDRSTDTAQFYRIRRP